MGVGEGVAWLSRVGVRVGVEVGGRDPVRVGVGEGRVPVAVGKGVDVFVLVGRKVGVLVAVGWAVGVVSSSISMTMAKRSVPPGPFTVCAATHWPSF
jgi:hypothetical protein